MWLSWGEKELVLGVSGSSSGSSMGHDHAKIQFLTPEFSGAAQCEQVIT